MENRDVAAGVVKNQIRAIRIHIEQNNLDDQFDEIFSNIKRIQRRECSDDCVKWLKNSWNTERILRMSEDYLGENPFALQWNFPQAYYAVFCLYQSLVIAQGNSCLSHKATLKDFSLKAEGNFFPRDFRFSLSGSPDDYVKHNLLNGNYEVLSFRENDMKSVDSQIFHFLKATRKECLESHKKDYLKRKKRTRLLTGEMHKVAAEVEKTSLLHLLYRKRIKANYKDVDTFLSEYIDSVQICNDLAEIVWRVNSVLEYYLSRYVGIKKIEQEYELFDPYSEMKWLSKRIKFYRKSL